MVSLLEDRAKMAVEYLPRREDIYQDATDILKKKHRSEDIRYQVAGTSNVKKLSAFEGRRQQFENDGRGNQTKTIKFEKLSARD